MEINGAWVLCNNNRVLYTVFHESVRHFGWIGVANLLVRACISFRLSTLNVDALGSQQGLEALATKDRR